MPVHGRHGVLMDQPRRRGHEQDPVDDFVAASVVWQEPDVFDGPLALGGRGLWHRHTMNLLGLRTQLGMGKHGDGRLADRYRIR